MPATLTYNDIRSQLAAALKGEWDRLIAADRDILVDAAIRAAALHTVSAVRPLSQDETKTLSAIESNVAAIGVVRAAAMLTAVVAVLLAAAGRAVAGAAGASVLTTLAGAVGETAQGN
jgi:cytolysin (calcineurin-like family phosphatase)